jgi:putative tryptophan/tyrosine transport system substrate-binding protein
MMERRAFVSGAVGLLAAPVAVQAQQPAKVPRIGYLESGAPGTPLVEAFRQGLRDLGWIEGQNIAVEVRAAEGKYDRLPELAAELARLKVDVIFASSTPAALAAKHATTTIPIVIGRVADPVGSGLVTTLARPGGNITGWTHQGIELRVKYLDLLKEAVPEATRIGVLWNPDNPIHGPSLRSMEATAAALKVELHPVGARDPQEIESAFSVLAQKRVQALTVFQDGMFLAQGPLIIALAARSRIPTMYGLTDLVRTGGLMGYGVNLPGMYRHAASFVDRILKGAKPADIPVEQPTKFEFVINLKTAKTLGLTIPPSVLARADEVIQ